MLTDEVKPNPVGVTSALALTVDVPKDDANALPLKEYDCCVVPQRLSDHPSDTPLSPATPLFQPDCAKVSTDSSPIDDVIALPGGNC